MSNGETFDTKSQLLNILFKPFLKLFMALYINLALGMPES